MSPPRADFTSPSSFLPETWVEETEDSVPGNPNITHICLRLHYTNKTPSTQLFTCNLLIPGAFVFIQEPGYPATHRLTGAHMFASRFHLKQEQLLHCRPTYVKERCTGLTCTGGSRLSHPLSPISHFSHLSLLSQFSINKVQESILLSEHDSVDHHADFWWE